jgi:hypothetical protein
VDFAMKLVLAYNSVMPLFRYSERKGEMAQPIYKVFLLKPTEAWYQLSKAQQDALLKKLNKAFEKAGGKRLALCDSSWSSDQWTGFGVEMFPSIEAVQQYMKALNDLNWLRYGESISVLGTEWVAP